MSESPFHQPVRQNATAMAALIVGVLTPASGLVFMPLALFVGIAAVILGNRALYHFHKNPELHGKGQAAAGVVLGIIGIFMGVFGIGVMIYQLLNQGR